MPNKMIPFLSDMMREIFIIVGVGYIHLIVLITFRAGRLRGLNEDNMAERLGDLCFDTIKDKIQNKIDELLQLDSNNALVLPPGRRIQDIALHQDSESLADDFLKSYRIGY